MYSSTGHIDQLCTTCKDIIALGKDLSDTLHELEIVFDEQTISDTFNIDISEWIYQLAETTIYQNETSTMVRNRLSFE